jgi:hypothetical protein
MISAFDLSLPIGTSPKDNIGPPVACNLTPGNAGRANPRETDHEKLKVRPNNRNRSDGVRAAALAASSRLVNANMEALQACSDTAKKAGKEQKCSIIVQAPVQ